MAKQNKKQKDESEFQKRQAIIAQALSEIRFARTYKQGKVGNWILNENLYYSRKIAPEGSRSNVDLGQMQSFVHTILSKIDNPLIFKFIKRKESQRKRVARLNSLRVYDQKRDHWDIKDIVGKKQAIIYGRAIYSYFADSVTGYTPHLDNVDVYDFLIDPSAGGIDIERANYLGDYGVVFSREELRDGIDSGRFLEKETNLLITGSSNVPVMTQEETNKIPRTQDQGTVAPIKEMSGTDVFKFWRWGTTYKGERYYLLLDEKGGQAVELKLLDDVKDDGLWWYWTYAAFPDMTEFWTPSFCDYTRELFMAQAVSVNQGLDNGEQINKPQRIVNVSAIQNMGELKYRREGIIKVNKSFDATKAIQFVTTPSIQTPIQIFELLEGIISKNSGVTAGDQGNADNKGDSKVAIYEGNQANSADKYGFLNKSYSFGYDRFATLYLGGVKQHLVKKVAVDILGPDGIDIEEISRKDIFWKNDKFGVMVESSNAELDLTMRDKELKLKFLTDEALNPESVLNKKKSTEMRAEIVGFNEEQVRQLLDSSDFGDADLMSEAENDIELILDGQKIPPNPEANTAYKQRIVNYMTKNQYKLDAIEYEGLVNYVKTLDTVIARNMIAQANRILMEQSLKSVMAGGSGSNPDEAGAETTPASGAPALPAGPLPNNQQQ